MEDILKQLDLDHKNKWLLQEIYDSGKKWRQLYTFVAYILCKRIAELNILKKKPIKEAVKLIIPYYKKALSGAPHLDYFYKAHLALAVTATEAQPNYNQFSFLGGWLLLQEDSPNITHLVFSLIDQCVKEEELINDNNLFGDFLRTFPNFSEAARLRAAQRLMGHFKRPIHQRRWDYLREDINRELSHRAEISGTSPLKDLPGYPRKDSSPLISKTPKELVDLSILGSLFSLPKSTYKRGRKYSWEEWKETHLEELSLNELVNNPKTLKRIMNRLSTRDIAPPGWRRKHIDILWVEEREYPEEGERMGELELAAWLIQRKMAETWFEQEVKQAEREVKLDSFNLTPRERAIIEAKLAGIEPSGTPGSIKTALSKLRRKIKKTKKIKAR